MICRIFARLFHRHKADLKDISAIYFICRAVREYYPSTGPFTAWYTFVKSSVKQFHYTGR